MSANPSTEDSSAVPNAIPSIPSSPPPPDQPSSSFNSDSPAVISNPKQLPKPASSSSSSNPNQNHQNNSKTSSSKQSGGSTGGYVRSSRAAAGSSGNATSSVSVAHFPGLKVLMISEVRGRLSWLNDLAQRTGADCVIHTGNFGFYDENSFSDLNEAQLRAKLISHATWNYLVLSNNGGGSGRNGNSTNRYSYFNLNEFKAKTSSMSEKQLREMCRKQTPFSELSDFISGKKRFRVPVYTNYGHMEDVRVLEKFSNGSIAVKNVAPGG